MCQPHHRREFLKRAIIGWAGAGLLPLLPSPVGAASPPAPGSVRITDTHVHFYDPKRAGGVPWPPKDDPVLYRTVRPGDYLALEKPQPVAGVIVVEASPWLEDNQWVLDLAGQAPLIVGMVGTLPVAEETFEAQLKRFAAQRLFRGIRLRPGPPRTQWAAPRFLADLKLLAKADLALDLVGGIETLELAQKLAAADSSLRIIVDHLAGLQIDGEEPPRAWLEAIRGAARHRNVFMKVSGLVEGTGLRGGNAPKDLEFYRPTLDAVYSAFGPSHLIYGSNWPVCEHFASLATVQRLATGYFAAKGQAVLAKVMSGNSQRAYRWRR